MRIPFVKPIGIFVLLRIMLWFACFLIVGVMMKAFGYPDQMPIERSNPTGLFFRHWGLIFALIPMIWMLWASWDWELNDTSEWRERDHVIVGAALLGLTIVLVIVLISCAQPSMPSVREVVLTE